MWLNQKTSPSIVSENRDEIVNLGWMDRDFTVAPDIASVRRYVSGMFADLLRMFPFLVTNS